MSRKMTGKLKQLAEENGGKIYQDLVFSKRPLVRFRNSPALDHLERTFFRYPYTRYYGGEREIMLVQAKDPADEIGTATGISPWSAGIFRDMAGRSREALKRIGSRCS